MGRRAGGKARQAQEQNERYGQISRALVIPTNPQTPAQQGVRANFATVVKRCDSFTEPTSIYSGGGDPKPPQAFSKPAECTRKARQLGSDPEAESRRCTLRSCEIPGNKPLATGRRRATNSVRFQPGRSKR